MSPHSRIKPLSIGHKLLRQGQLSGTLPNDTKNFMCKLYPKDQSERHEASFKSLFELSENTSLFLPISGKYERPFVLNLINPARPYVATLHETRGEKAFRKSTLFEVRTPECAHGLGVMDWHLHCHGVKNISEKYLTIKFLDYGLSPTTVGFMSLIRLGLAAYGHDVPEDSRKYNPENPVSPSKYAKEALALTLNHNLAKILKPILTADIKALTDDPNLHGWERLQAQKIPPRKEREELLALGIIDKKTIGTGPIGTIKFLDKGQQNTSDLLCSLLGKQSFFKDLSNFFDHIEPRIDIVSSLHVPESYKALYMETTDRLYELLIHPVKETPTKEKAEKLIRYELSRIQKILAGGPHIPIRKRVYSSYSASKLAQ
jgi:hypothetical protein